MSPASAHFLPVAIVLGTVLSWGCERDPQAKHESEDPAQGGPLIQLNRPEPARAKGRVFDDRDFRLEVGTPRLCNETAPFLPEPGLMRISIPVEVRAKTPRLIPISPLSFQLTDHEDRKYGPTLAGCFPALQNLRLEEGQSVRGDVAFDVHVGARNLELTFDPFLIGRTEVQALVRVPGLPIRPRNEELQDTDVAPAPSAAAPPAPAPPPQTTARD